MRFGIKFKLVFAFLISNALLATLMFAVSSWRFDQGFSAYITQVEIQRVQGLIDELSRSYEQYKSWDPIASNYSRWDELVRENVSNDSRPPRNNLNEGGMPPPPRMRRPDLPFDGGGSPNSERPPPPRPAGLLERRLLLGDQSKNVLIGREVAGNTTEWVGIQSNGETVGYLGLTSQDFIPGSLDRLFVIEQKNAYAWIAAMSLVLAVLVGLVLASRWLRPIRLLQAGMQKLAAGDFSLWLGVSGNDEIAELSRQFNSLARTLDKNKLSQGQWIADISHELRTPVAVLRGEIEALIDGVRPLNEARIKSLFDEVIQLQALVSELHELSLSDLGALKYEKKVVKFSEFFTPLLTQFTRASAEAGLDFSCSGSEVYPSLLADERKLKQLFVNLFQNSINYTDQPGKVAVSWRLVDGFLQIEWSDSAPSVDDEEKAKLFNRLFRAENSRNRLTGGSGLGLAIVQNIVEAHEGSVEVLDSNLGGLMFKISFPILLQ